MRRPPHPAGTTKRLAQATHVAKPKSMTMRIPFLTAAFIVSVASGQETTASPTASPIGAPAAAVAWAPLAASPASPMAGSDDKRKAPKGYHSDTRYGFQFKQPKKWDNIAIKVEEEWLAAKYTCQTEYSYYDKKIGRTYLHNPEILVIAFPLEAMKAKSEAKKSKDGSKTTITIKNPYRDYDDFLSRTFEGGGYFKSGQEEDEVNGVKVTKLTYTVEKLSNNGPQTISTWIYHSEDVDYAVQIVGLTKHWKKIEKSFKPVRQTFQLIERDGPLKISGGTGDEVTISRIDLEKGNDKEKKSVAVKSEKVMHERAIAKLPPEGWDHKADGKVLAIYSADRKYAGRVQDHCNNLIDWLDKKFGFLGAEAYMRKPIVRICKDIDEAAAYTAGVTSGGYGGSWDLDDELVTWWDAGGWTGRAVDRLNSQVYRYWMLEKNFGLSTAMPEWIDVGLEALVENARMDSRKIDWRYDASLVNVLRDAIRRGDPLKIQDMFLMTSKEYNDRSSREVNPWAEGAMLINYLASPEVRRHHLAKDMLERYLRNMMKVVDEVEKEEKRKLDGARSRASKDGGEREYIEERRRIFQQMEKELLQRTFDLTFAQFDESDWAALNKAFHDAY